MTDIPNEPHPEVGPILAASSVTTAPSRVSFYGADLSPGVGFSDGSREWARLGPNGTFTIIDSSGVEHVATPEQAIAAYVRVSAEFGWAPFAALVDIYNSQRGDT